MNEFEIEKEIPIPTARNRRLYPWTKMKVGDSFFVPNQPGIDKNLRSSARYYGLKVCIRNVEGGFRVWRIA